MWEAFENSIREHVPDAQSKLVFDRFHMMKHMKDAVDQVRKVEHKALQAVGDERFTGTKYDWLKGRDKFDREEWDEFRELRAAN